MSVLLKSEPQKVKVTSLPVSPIRILVMFGVFWYMWGAHGFWWGVLYGFFWPVWVGYRLAEYLVEKGL